MLPERLLDNLYDGDDADVEVGPDAEGSDDSDALVSLLGSNPIPCEHNAVSPCVKKKPLPADWMVRIDGHCNCTEDGEDRTKAFCGDCFQSVWQNLRRLHGIACGRCGLVFVPATDYFADTVRLHR